MNIELKPIAESKVRQLGGTVCGVLVRKDEKLAAVDEHGRVQWLQSGQGVEPAADFKVEIRSERDPCDEYVSYLAVVSDGKSHPYLHIPETLDQEVLDEMLRRLNAHPQPAQQGGAPSRDDLIQCVLATQRQSEGVMADAILSMFTAPQPEGDGWIKCSERLPTEDDQYVWLYFKGHGVSDQIWSWGDDIGKHGETHWMPTGLKRPQPPKEGYGDERA